MHGELDRYSIGRRRIGQKARTFVFIHRTELHKPKIFCIVLFRCTVVYTRYLVYLERQREVMRRVFASAFGWCCSCTKGTLCCQRDDIILLILRQPDRLNAQKQFTGFVNWVSQRHAMGKLI